LPKWCLNLIKNDVDHCIRTRTQHRGFIFIAVRPERYTLFIDNFYDMFREMIFITRDLYKTRLYNLRLPNAVRPMALSLARPHCSTNVRYWTSQIKLRNFFCFAGRQLFTRIGNPHRRIVPVEWNVRAFRRYVGCISGTPLSEGQTVISSFSFLSNRQRRFRIVSPLCVYLYIYICTWTRCDFGTESSLTTFGEKKKIVFHGRVKSNRRDDKRQ